MAEGIQNPSEQGPYTKRTAELFHIALKLLKNAGGQMPLRDILENIPKAVELRDRDLVVHQTGGVRWSTALQFYAINYEKAGFITREQGVWSLTPEGDKALQFPAVQVFSQAGKAYRMWKNSVTDGEKTDDESDENPSASAEVFANQARTGIADAVLALTAYEFQSFVATILRGWGYHIARIAPPGPDGGTDILAFPDPIGATRPHVRAQVKHWKNQKAGREDVAGLRGVLIPDREIGLFVSSGGFSGEALREAARGSPHIRCMDLDQLIDAYVENYDRIEPRYRDRVPLKQIHIYAPDSV